jgi:hypothetical protein
VNSLYLFPAPLAEHQTGFMVLLEEARHHAGRRSQ